jgi:uncharacterized protein VirK/YbjX
MANRGRHVGSRRLTGILEADRRVTFNVNHQTSVNDSPTAANGGLLVPLSIVATHKDSWSPARVARVTWSVLTNVGEAFRIVQLFKLKVFKDFLHTNPRFLFKCLIRDYLAQGLSVAQSMACFSHHYRRLHSYLPDPLLRRTLYSDITLHEAKQDDTPYSITLCFSRAFEKEGELSLNLFVDGAEVFVLSFTIVPGRVVQSPATDVLLISRLQGVHGYFNQIRRATKAFHDVGPPALLLAALHGFAAALGVDEFAAVSSTRQSSYTKELSSLYISAYDDFFFGLGLAKKDSGFFLSPIPHPDKPLSSIKQGHKLRTKEKRAFKLQIAQAVCRALQQEVAAGDAEPLVSGFAHRIPDVIES